MKDLYLIVFLLSLAFQTEAKNQPNGRLSGTISIDSSWSRSIYLSYIPSFNDMHTMSNDMIVSRAELDSLGNFHFNLDILPAETGLFRLHITKKGSSEASLIIGGDDENHLFFIANRESVIELEIPAGKPVFQNVKFDHSIENNSFHTVSSMVQDAEYRAANSSATKREFIERKLEEDLMFIADTTNNVMVALHALNSINQDSYIAVQHRFLSSFLNRWKAEENAYLTDFRTKHKDASGNSSLLYWIIGGIVCVGCGFLLGRLGSGKKDNLSKLSIQERKIFEYLKQGASNQEISDEFNIGLSTVKTHVSSIYSKLKVKSRKEIMDL